MEWSELAELREQLSVLPCVVPSSSYECVRLDVHETSAATATALQLTESLEPPTNCDVPSPSLQNVPARSATADTPICEAAQPAAPLASAESPLNPNDLRAGSLEPAALDRISVQLRDEAFDSVASEVADEVLSLVLGERLQRESAGAHEVGSQQRPSESRADAFTVKRSESPAAADRSLRCAEPQPDLTKAKACPQPAIAAAVTEQGRHGVTGSAMPISTPAHS